MPHDGLTLSAVFALLEEKLAENGFYVSRRMPGIELPGDHTLLAEDDYSIIAAAGFHAWSSLETEWPEAQSALTSLLAQRLARSAPKAWDGYLVLISASGPPTPASLVAIERDTTRLRKLVATGDMVSSTGGVLTLLDPFLPLPLETAGTIATDALDSLPDVLDSVSAEAVRTVVNAYRELAPPLEALHQFRLRS